MEQKIKLSTSKSEKLFSIAENTEKKEFYVTIGNNVISNEIFKTKKDAETYIAGKPWELILNAAIFCVTKQIEMNNAKK